MALVKYRQKGTFFCVTFLRPFLHLATSETPMFIEK